MALTICLYEDPSYKNFFPITHLRPVYFLRPGIFPLYQKVTQHFKFDSLFFQARDQLAPLVAEQEKDYPVNMLRKGDGNVLFLNGRVKDYGNLPELVKQAKLTTLFQNKDTGELVAILFHRESIENIPALATSENYLERFTQERSTIPEFETTATLYNYCWDFVNDIDRAIEDDFKYLHQNLPEPNNVIINDGAWLVNKEQIYLSNDVQIAPGSLIDASKGPVFIGANTKIESQVAIYGPSFIGANSVIVAGKIASCSIGHTSRAGGEIEETIFQSYVNKYHAGFIGHSYVGSWVNFGAMTTNSDLKNNYSNIRVTLNDEVIDTNYNKVGSFIGDHTKFGIGTLLNTGINIGVCCNIFGGTLIADKEVPSFQWGQTGNYQAYNYDKAIDTARKTSDRRNHTLSKNEVNILRAISEETLADAGLMDFPST